MTLIIDAQTSGVAGNMFIGAFIDLGADKEKISEVIKNYASEFGEVEISITKAPKSGVMSTFANIETKDNTTRHFDEIIDKLDEITENKYPNDEIIEKTIKLSKKVFESMAIAESEVHGVSIDKLHFHEVGCADAIADVVGSCYAYYLLELDKEKIYSLPVATGSGSVKTQHGILPVPAPAVANLLKNVPSFNGPVSSEIATPTGCAILINITDEFVSTTPVITNKTIGYGAGKKDLEVLNALRLIKAEEMLECDSISVLETNVDTLTGEVMGSLFDKLISEGARDVSITPTIMKKNRPGHIIKVITSNVKREHVIRVLMEETGSLGVRVMPNVHRGISKREFKSVPVTVNGISQDITFKIGYVGKKVIKCTPEYEDVKLLADKTNVPIKDLMQICQQEYNNY